MNCKQLVTPLLAMLTMAGCIKHQSNPGTTSNNPQIDQVKVWFVQNVAGQATVPNSANYRAKLSRTLRWDQASVVSLSGTEVVVVPIEFSKDVYLRADNSGPALFSLSDVSRLVIYRDSANNMQCQQLTFVPDSTMHPGDSTFNGIMLTEDWSGNTLAKPSQIGNHHSHTTVDIVAQQQVCNTLYGYNYSADDPADTYEWSETTCTTYSFVEAPLGGHSGLSSPAPVTRKLSLSYFSIKVSPPTTPIQSIADYFGCFTNSASPDHTYSVQVCVDQPDPGTRQPWTFTPGGAAGTSATGNPLNVGHTFLILTENSQGNIITRSVGFYPLTGVYPISGYTSAQGVLGNDDEHEYNISVTINVSATQFFGILNSITLGNNAGYYYDLNTNNCTTFAINVLGTNGISLPATQGTWGVNGKGDDPGDLGQDVSQMSLGSNMTRNTVSNPHPNTGSCN